MLFNSFAFFLFLPAVFILYWFVLGKRHRLQNALLLLASYVFYGWWDWRFLSLIAFSTLVDYGVGLAMGREEREGPRKWLMALSLVTNLGLLGFFKYFNFFVDSFAAAFATVGIAWDAPTLQIILPVGISFYTFQTLSYSLDIYKGRLEPSRDLLSFAAFVSFFPQLVAGPIERAVNFLPQILKPRTFRYEQGVQGMRLILWGLFKKVVIADNLALYVERCFSEYEEVGSLTLLLGAVYFTVQIYCDFSGYSDIAIGAAKLFGFELMSNFRFPFFARSIPEFWARWHISLTTWLNDYLFTPLSIKWRHYRKRGIAAAIVVTFLVSGLWHGANWTFVVWGGLHGLLFIPYVMRSKLAGKRTPIAEGRALPSLPELMQVLGIFLLWAFVLVFFRSPDLGAALGYFKQMATHPGGAFVYKSGILYVLLVFVLDWINRKDERNPKVLAIGPPAFRTALHTFLAISIFLNMLKGYQEFVYFQF